MYVTEFVCLSLITEGYFIFEFELGIFLRQCFTIIIVVNFYLCVWLYSMLEFSLTCFKDTFLHHFPEDDFFKSCKTFAEIFVFVSLPTTVRFSLPTIGRSVAAYFHLT